MLTKISESNIFKVIFILSGIMIIGKLFDEDRLTSASFYLSFICVMLLWILVFSSRPSKVDILAISIIVIALINSLITANKVATLDYFEKYILFASSVLYLSISFRIKLTPKDVIFLQRFGFVLCGLVLIVFLLRQSACFYYTNTGVAYLTFGFSNPNATALFLTCIGIHSIISLLSIPKKTAYFGALAVAIIWFYLLFLTKSRTALIVFVLFNLLAVFSWVRKKAFYPKNDVFYFIVSIMPILFATFYQIIFKLNMNVDGLDFLVSEGKSLSSRESVWQKAFSLISDNPIIGNYGYTYESKLQHMHNSHLEVASVYGIPVLLLVCALLYYILINITKNNSKEVVSYLSKVGFISVLLLGIGEAALFAGGLSFYLLVGEFATLANHNSVDDEVSINE